TSASRLRTLVNDLLDYSRIYSEERFEKIDLNKLIADVLSDLEIQVKASECVFEITPLPVVDGVSSQLRQAFQNLVSNSLKFARKDATCRIRITGEAVVSQHSSALAPQEGKYCRISIQDNGSGYNPEFSQRNFEIFQRLEGPNEFE